MPLTLLATTGGLQGDPGDPGDPGGLLAEKGCQGLPVDTHGAWRNPLATWRTLLAGTLATCLSGAVVGALPYQLFTGG